MYLGKKILFWIKRFGEKNVNFWIYINPWFGTETLDEGIVKSIEEISSKPRKGKEMVVQAGFRFEMTESLI